MAQREVPRRRSTGSHTGSATVDAYQKFLSDNGLATHGDVADPAFGNTDVMTVRFQPLIPAPQVATLRNSGLGSSVEPQLAVQFCCKDM